MVFTRLYYYKTQQKVHISDKISHHAETKHITQSYTNNKRPITHNDNNTKKSKAIPATHERMSKRFLQALMLKFVKPEQA
jgi:hypothetical protein